MSKTKNAFAFRDFDAERILQRPFFKNFYFESDKSDEEILQSLNNVTDESVDSWEKNLYAIKAIHDRLEKFRHLINRHNEKRLDKYNKKKSISERIKIIELQRPEQGLFFFYNQKCRRVLHSTALLETLAVFLREQLQFSRSMI